jgi:hypothetical protein
MQDHLGSVNFLEELKHGSTVDQIRVLEDLSSLLDCNAVLLEEVSLDSVEGVHVLESLVEGYGRVSLERTVFDVVFQKLLSKVRGEAEVFDEHAKQRVALFFVETVLGNCVIEVGDDVDFSVRLLELADFFEE